MSSSHGNTPTAWAAVVVGLIGFLLGGIGVMFTPMNQVLFYSGVGVALVAVVIYLAGMRLDARH